MDKQSAINLIRETFENPFDKGKYIDFIKNLFNKILLDSFEYSGQYIPDTFKSYINKYERIGKYMIEDKRVDILVVYLNKETSIERARTMQRNFVGGYLAGKYGSASGKDAAVVAFVSPGLDNWRFSLVKMEYKLTQTKSGRTKGEEEFTPARRWSFLVGSNEASHTAQSRLVNILADDKHNPTFQELEEAFNVEKVTKEFINKYRDLYLELKNSIDRVVENDKVIREEFENKKVNTVDFSKKLLGQIVFLYFLQKKGWLGVPKDKNWGGGNRNFLRSLFNKCNDENKNFFNEYLEVLFYNTLNDPRLNHADTSYSKYFDCRIPFLNGGLFEPINNYDWKHRDIIIPNELFSNNEKTNEGDIGSGILDVFDRYNFTVQEDEPLEKEVALDPELLGKVFENLIEENMRKEQGAYYTPREIVHYMCQESLINYLVIELKAFDDKLSNETTDAQQNQVSNSIENKITKTDIEKFIKYGEDLIENEKTALQKEEDIKSGKQKSTSIISKIPESIKNNAELLDEKLANIRVCDPAVGSGAFPVGMMLEIVKARNVLTNYFSEKEERTPYNFKRQCIENCLYGVDIDSSAIDIAKLRFWLSLVVDEEDITKIKPLPNLDYKLICGNSLLSVERDLFNDKLFNQLEELKPRYFNETNTDKKIELKKQIDELIKQITNNDEHFDFKVYFSEVFHEKEGFDVVIANPPYVDSENMIKQNSRLRNTYTTLFESAKGNWDLFIIFIERGINLLKKNGIISYIVPNKLTGAKYSEALRNILVKKNIKEIRDYSKVNVFKEAGVYPITFVIINNEKKYDVLMTVMDSEEDIENQNEIPEKVFYCDIDWSRYFTREKDNIKVLIKLSKYNQLFKYFPKISGAATVSEAYELKKILREENNNLKKFKKFINTGTIDPYISLWGFKKTSYIKNSYIKPVVIDTDLQEFSLNRYKQANSEKIIIGGMTQKLECYYDTGNYLAGKSTTIIQAGQKSLKFLLAILNSNLISFWYCIFFKSLSLAGGFLRISNNEIKRIPLVDADEESQSPFIDLVDKILSITKDDDYLKNPNKQSQVKEYQRQIDQLVYKLYGLTEEEIKIVEGFR